MIVIAHYFLYRHMAKAVTLESSLSILILCAIIKHK